MNMRFTYAWYNLMHHHEIRRNDWPDGDRLKLINNAIYLVHIDETREKWQPMQYDMMADNWSIYGVY